MSRDRRIEIKIRGLKSRSRDIDYSRKIMIEGAQKRCVQACIDCQKRKARCDRKDGIACSACIRQGLKCEVRVDRRRRFVKIEDSVELCRALGETKIETLSQASTCHSPILDRDESCPESFKEVSKLVKTSDEFETGSEWLPHLPVQEVGNSLFRELCQETGFLFKSPFDSSSDLWFKYNNLKTHYANLNMKPPYHILKFNELLNEYYEWTYFSGFHNDMIGFSAFKMLVLKLCIEFDVKDLNSENMAMNTRTIDSSDQLLFLALYNEIVSVQVNGDNNDQGLLKSEEDEDAVGLGNLIKNVAGKSLPLFDHGQLGPRNKC